MAESPRLQVPTAKVKGSAPIWAGRDRYKDFRDGEDSMVRRYAAPLGRLTIARHISAGEMYQIVADEKASFFGCEYTMKQKAGV